MSLKSNPEKSPEAFFLRRYQIMMQEPETQAEPKISATVSITVSLDAMKRTNHGYIYTVTFKFTAFG